MAQVASITAAIKATGYTATGLADALMRVTDVPHTGEAVSRVEQIMQGLGNIPFKDASRLLSDAAKGAKDTAQASTVKVRCSEARQILGAVKFGAFVVKAGWKQAVEDARKCLKDAGIKPNGEKIPTEEERQAKHDEAVMLGTLAENLIGVDTKDEAKVAQLAAEAAQRAQSLGATQKQIDAHAVRIATDRGIAYANALGKVLVALVAEDDAEPEVE